RENLSKKTEIPIRPEDELSIALKWSRAEGAKGRLYMLVGNTIDVNIIDIGDYMDRLYVSEKILPLAASPPSWTTKVVPKQEEQGEQQQQQQKEEQQQEVDEIPISNDIVTEYVYRDLFLWSILTHRIEMAKLFLKYMRTRICASLIAARIIRKVSRLEYDQAIRSEYEDEAEYFESFAIECLKYCYAADKEYA
ncbi:unnamed protein product, partial [Didymodactylos carnosus]